MNLLAGLMFMFATGDPIVDINALKVEVNASSLAGNRKLLLTQVLNSAIARINQGNPSGAAALMRTFKAYVQSFVNGGALDATTGASWIAEADAIIAEL